MSGQPYCGPETSTTFARWFGGAQFFSRGDILPLTFQETLGTTYRS